MDFDLPADVEQLRRTVRMFVDEAVIPAEQAIEKARVGLPRAGPVSGCHPPLRSFIR